MDNYILTTIIIILLLVTTVKTQQLKVRNWQNCDMQNQPRRNETENPSSPYQRAFVC
jgi:hypothetical protein